MKELETILASSNSLEDFLETMTNKFKAVFEAEPSKGGIEAWAGYYARMVA